MASRNRARGILRLVSAFSPAYGLKGRRGWLVLLLGLAILALLGARKLGLRRGNGAAAMRADACLCDTLPLYHEPTQPAVADLCERLHPVEGSVTLTPPSDVLSAATDDSPAPAASAGPTLEPLAGKSKTEYPDETSTPPTLPWPLLPAQETAITTEAEHIAAPRQEQPAKSDAGNRRESAPPRPWVEPIGRPWAASGTATAEDAIPSHGKLDIPVLPLEISAFQPAASQASPDAAREDDQGAATRRLAQPRVEDRVPLAPPRPAPRGADYTREVQRMLKPISQVTNSLAMPPGDDHPDVPDEYEKPRLPRARELFATETGQVQVVLAGQMRPWPELLFAWEAPGLYHLPLYFQEVTLERYGWSWGLAQPVVSAAHFFGRLPALPYLMTVDPPHRCVYTLGHYRPGSCVPPYLHTVPFDPLAAAAQAGAVTGLVYLIP